MQIFPGHSLAINISKDLKESQKNVLEDHVQYAKSKQIRHTRLKRKKKNRENSQIVI